MTCCLIAGKKSCMEKDMKGKKERKGMNVAVTYPSMKGQRPMQEHWIGVTENHRRLTCCPEPSFQLQSALATGFRHSGC